MIKKKKLLKKLKRQLQITSILSKLGKIEKYRLSRTRLRKKKLKKPKPKLKLKRLLLPKKRLKHQRRIIPKLM